MDEVIGTYFSINKNLAVRRQLKFRLLSYNIHKGLHHLHRQAILGEIKKAIHLTEADIVCLQEICGAHPKDEVLWSSSQFEFIADKVWYHYAYGKNAVYSSGHHGNAVLSKFPISSWQNINVSNHPFERRGLLYAKVEMLPIEKVIHIICIHLDLTEWGRVRQIKKMIEMIKANIPENEALIIAGDFNDWTQKASNLLNSSLSLSEAHKVNKGHYARTFPSWFPILPLDRVYFRGLEIQNCQVLRGSPWSRLSDHNALVVDMEIY